MDYTAIGREMNLAARIQALAEADGILISHATSALVHDRYLVEEREPATLKGFHRPVRLYRVVMD
jgi:class 3 adenylate cyclase